MGVNLFLGGAVLVRARTTLGLKRIVTRQFVCGRERECACVRIRMPDGASCFVDVYRCVWGTVYLVKGLGLMGPVVTWRELAAENKEKGTRKKKRGQRRGQMQQRGKRDSQVVSL